MSDAHLIQCSEHARLVSYVSVHTAPAIAEIEQGFVGTLEQNQKAFYQFALPEGGATVKIDVETGSVVLYASNTIQNPNEALYDYKLETSSSSDVYISPDDFEDTTSITKRQAMPPANTNITIYISIEGQSGINSFSLNTTYGDTTSTEPTTAGNSYTPSQAS